MSVMDRLARSRPALSACLILLVCASSLAVHIIVEGRAPAGGGPAAELGEDAGRIPAEVHEHSEDLFVATSPEAVQAAGLFISAPPPADFCPPSLSISPLLPPPNL